MHCWRALSPLAKHCPVVMSPVTSTQAPFAPERHWSLVTVGPEVHVLSFACSANAK